MRCKRADKADRQEPVMTMQSKSFIAAAAAAALAVGGGGLMQAASSEQTVRYGDIPANAYAVVAEVRAKPGKEDELRAATLPLVRAVRSEPNNVVYFLHEDRAEPGHFIFYEIFATQDDFAAHNTTPRVQAWFARLPELAVGGVTVTHMRLDGNTPDMDP